MFAPLIAALLASSAPAALREKDAMLPFPSVLLGTGGGGGGGPSRFTHVGNTGASDANMASGANLCVTTKVTLAAGGSVYAVCIRQFSATAGIHVKAVIYSDNAGSPGTLLVTGTEYTTSAGGPLDISLPLAAPYVIAAGNYWIGWIADGNLQVDGVASTGNQKWYAQAYTSGPLASPTSFTSSTTATCVYLSIGDSTPESGTGFVSNQQSARAGTANDVRGPFPVDRAPGDLAFLHVTFVNTSGAPAWTAPFGWTLILEHAIGGAGNYRELLYWRRIDGTECYPSTGVTTANTGALMINVSLWRGYTATGTPYEAFASTGGTNTNPSGSTITTLGANRTVINFYSQSTTVALGNANANGWAEKYDDTAAGAGGCLAACSAKDVAAAGSVTAEARTEASQWWECFTLALIKA